MRSEILIFSTIEPIPFLFTVKDSRMRELLRSWLRISLRTSRAKNSKMIMIWNFYRIFSQLRRHCFNYLSNRYEKTLPLNIFDFFVQTSTTGPRLKADRAVFNEQVYNPSNAIFGHSIGLENLSLANNSMLLSVDHKEKTVVTNFKKTINEEYIDLQGSDWKSYYKFSKKMVLFLFFQP